MTISAFTASVSSACGLIYKQNNQQGNTLEQEDLDELYIGMNPRQVLFVGVKRRHGEICYSVACRHITPTKEPWGCAASPHVDALIR